MGGVASRLQPEERRSDQAADDQRHEQLGGPLFWECREEQDLHKEYVIRRAPEVRQGPQLSTGEEPEEDHDERNRPPGADGVCRRRRREKGRVGSERERE
jgi:hypothetical protein